MRPSASYKLPILILAIIFSSIILMGCEKQEYLDAPYYIVGVTIDGVSRGTVTMTNPEKNPTTLVCQADCSGTYNSSYITTLVAEEKPGFAFEGWEGACTGLAKTCTVGVNSAKSGTPHMAIVEVTAKFAGGVAILAAPKGSGSGSISGLQDDIVNCGHTGGRCAYAYPSSTQKVGLKATADPGSIFIGWTGCSPTIGNMCYVYFTEGGPDNVAVFAEFNKENYALNVGKTGDGTGTVLSFYRTAAGMGSTHTYDNYIDCGAKCSSTLPTDLSYVALEETADAGSLFAGWTGCNSVNFPDLGKPECEIRFDTDKSAKSVGAKFVKGAYGVIVNRSGEGSGKVTSIDGKMNCGDSCFAGYSDAEAGASGFYIKLVATADPGSKFDSWVGCPNVLGGYCIIYPGDYAGKDNTMLVKAYFKKETAKQGDFAILTSIVSDYDYVGGTITSTPAGIDCPGDCTEVYSLGATVTLTARANSASDFIGWAGDCSGFGTSATCTLTKDDAVYFDGQNYTAAAMAQFIPKTVAPTSASVTITSSSCRFVGIYGINMREYEIILQGTVTGPAGGQMILYKNLGGGAAIRGTSSCGAWTYDGYDCYRAAGQPESVSWSHTYGFYAQTSNFKYHPYVTVSDEYGNLLDTGETELSCS